MTPLSASTGAPPSSTCARPVQHIRVRVRVRFCQGFVSDTLVSASTSAPPSSTCARPMQHVRALSVITLVTQHRARRPPAPAPGPSSLADSRACSSSQPLQARHSLSAPRAWLSKPVTGFAQRSVSQHGSAALHCLSHCRVAFLSKTYIKWSGVTLDCGDARERQTPEERFACVRMPSNAGQG